MAGSSVGHKEQSRTAVPAEGNFEEHPYFRVGDRNAGTGILKYENELRTKDGNVLHQSWVVRAVHGRGLPGRYDQDVYVGLLQLVDEKGLPEDGWLGFSIYELVELMGKRHSGREYQHVRESLQKLATTSIESQNAFYHKGRKTYISDTFSLLTEVKLAEYENTAGERRDRNRVHLSQYFVDSYKANYLKSIDVGFYWSLSSPVAKRLYRLIDKKRNGRSSWEVDIFSLKKRIPLSDYRYASKIREKLSPAHEELIGQGFLHKVDYRKTDGSEYVAYHISDGFHARRSSAGGELVGGDEMFCVQRLLAEGMARDAAEHLVREHGATRVMHYVEALPYQRNLRNPAGWLRTAIQNGYELDMPLPLSLPTEPPEHCDAGEHAEESLEVHPPVDVPESSPAAAEVWEQALEAAARENDSPTLRVWFEDTIPVSLENDRLTLSAPNLTAKDYIESRFREILERHLGEQLGSAVAVEVTSREVENVES